MLKSALRDEKMAASALRADSTLSPTLCHTKPPPGRKLCRLFERMETKIRQLKYPEIINGHMFSYQTWNSVTSRACVCLLFVWLGYPELILTLVHYHSIGDDNDGDGGGWKTPAHPAVVCLLLDWLHSLNKRATKFILNSPKKSYGNRYPDYHMKLVMTTMKMVLAGRRRLTLLLFVPAGWHLTSPLPL